MHFKRSTSIVLFALVAIAASAQNIRLNAYGGYTFKDRFPIGGSYYGYSYQEGAIEESAHFGGGLEFEVRPNQSVEIYYQNQPTTAILRTTLDSYRTDASANYLMLGGLGYAPFSPTLKGFGGLLLGAGWISSDWGSATKFAWGGRLGLLISPSDKVGIRLGAQLLSPVQGGGGGLYLGTGGAGAGVSTYSSIYQFGLFGGLAFTLGGSGGGGSRPSSSTPPPAPMR